MLTVPLLCCSGRRGPDALCGTKSYTFRCPALGTRLAAARGECRPESRATIRICPRVCLIASGARRQAGTYCCRHPCLAVVPGSHPSSTPSGMLLGAPKSAAWWRGTGTYAFFFEDMILGLDHCCTVGRRDVCFLGAVLFADATHPVGLARPSPAASPHVCRSCCGAGQRGRPVLSCRQLVLCGRRQRRSVAPDLAGARPECVVEGRAFPPNEVLLVSEPTRRG